MPIRGMMILGMCLCLFFTAPSHAMLDEEAPIGLMPVHLAAIYGGEQDVKDELVVGTANVHTLSKGGTPLHWAAAYGNIETMKYLLKAGADIEAAGKNKETPLHWAAYHEQANAVKFLLDQEANIEAKADLWLARG